MESPYPAPLTIYVNHKRMPRMSALINLIYPSIALCTHVNDNRVVTVCRLCESHTLRMNMFGTTGDFIYINRFLRHLLTAHNGSRYIADFGYGNIYFPYSSVGSGCDGSRWELFVEQNPHLLCMESNTFDYRELDMEINGGHIEWSNAINMIMEGNNGCMYCGVEYETFPTFEIFILHIDSCMPLAATLLRDVR